jgi:hypothetical protein
MLVVGVSLMFGFWILIFLRWLIFFGFRFHAFRFPLFHLIVFALALEDGAGLFAGETQAHPFVDFRVVAGALGLIGFKARDPGPEVGDFRPGGGKLGGQLLVFFRQGLGFAAAKGGVGD